MITSPRFSARGGNNARRSRRALLALGVVVLALGLAVSGLMWRDYHDSKVKIARETAQQIAREQVVTVLSYDFHRVDQDIQRASAALTGKLRDDFTTYAQQAAIPLIREQHITTQATVIDSAVVRASPEQVVVLLFVNQSMQSNQSEAVQLSAHRIQLTMSQVDGRWLISEFEQV